MPTEANVSGPGAHRVEIVGFRPGDADAIEALSQRAWTPVMEELRGAVPGFVYDSFYPDGWWARQRADIRTLLAEEAESVMVAVDGGEVLGWASTRLHPEDAMGELYILAVDPRHQRRGVGRALMDAAHRRMRDAGMRMSMVETGDDPGHAASRAAYEGVGYRRWPVARYFLEL